MQPCEIKRILIAGGGMMGKNIAFVFTKNPAYQVGVYDMKEVDVAGGIRQTEPALDLGIVLAILSGFRNKAVPDDLIVFGEVGLSGEVRSVSMAENRVQEAAKLGFHSCILPASSAKGIKVPDHMKLIPIRGIGQLAEYLREC